MGSINKKEKPENITNNHPRTAIIICTLTLFYCTLFASESPEKRGEKTGIILKGKALNIEIVDSCEKRKKGLMGRTDLGKNEGMLFVYDDSAIRHFWMKDTFIPLDIAFMDRDMVIGSVVSTRTVNDTTIIYSSSFPARYVLEVNRGWFEHNGVGRGDTMKWTKTGKVPR